MQCEIEWNSLNEEEWQACLDRVRRSNFLQSVPYAKAQKIIAAQSPKRGVIKIDGKAAGLILVLEAGLFWNLFHAVIIDRGPLWFDGFGGAVHIKVFLERLALEFPKRFGRKRRFIAEFPDGVAIQSMITQVGFEKIGKGYETLCLDITQELEVLKAQLKKNWRGSLSKAQRNHIECQWDKEGRFLDWFMKGYAADKSDKQYFGISAQNLHKMAQFMGQDGNMILGRAVKDGKAIAGIMVFCHGKSATYQAGWSTQTGRENNAHHLLLWQVINVLKQQGFHDFDLGGVNDETAQGVKLFKQGMGGQSICLVGHYR